MYKQDITDFPECRDLCDYADLRHFASSSGGLVVSIDPDTGTFSSLFLLMFLMNSLNK